MAAAVVVAVVWLGGLPGIDRDARQHDPVEQPEVTVEPRSMEGVVGSLEAGRWAMLLWPAEQPTLPQAVVEVPPGYETPGGGVIYREGESDTGEVSFWSVSQVYDDACQGRSAADPGPSVRDLADALVAQGGHRTTRPRPVTVDGHTGLYLKVTWPGRADLERCRDKHLRLWRSGAFEYLWKVPGTVARLWILDVNGARVVITASTTPHDDPTETAELLKIATTTHFADPLESAD